MSVQIRVDAKPLTESLSALGQRQIPFALSKALNGVLIDGQSEVVRGVRQRFTVRKPDFLTRAVKMVQFANRRTLTAVLAVTGPNADVYIQHEEGGQKVPRQARALAVPREVRRNKRELITKGNRPRGFGLQKKGTGPKATMYQGEKRTFAIRSQNGEGLLLQRVGRGKNSRVRLLYLFRRRVSLAPRLQFGDTVTQVILDRWDRQLDLAFTEAVRTAR